MPRYTRSICSLHCIAGHVFKIKCVTKNMQIDTNLQICKLTTSSLLPAGTDRNMQRRQGVHAASCREVTVVWKAGAVGLSVLIASGYTRTREARACLTDRLKGPRGKRTRGDGAGEQRSDKTDWCLRRPCYVIVIIVCLCKLVCDGKL